MVFSNDDNNQSELEFQPITVLPGDNVTSIIFPDGAPSAVEQQKNTNNNNEKKKKTVTVKFPKLGDGLEYNKSTNSVYCTLAGTLVQIVHQPRTSSNSKKKSSSSSSPPTYFIRNNKKRYIPKINDRVIGIIEDRMGGEYYRVNIFGPRPALLHTLEFEGATKRNRPNLQVGNAIYCRVDKVLSYGETYLTCKLSSAEINECGGSNALKRRDWMTDEGVYGILKGGTQIKISLGLAKRLLDPHNLVLNLLGGGKLKIPFEVAIGVNGQLWVNSNSVEETVLICNAIKNSEVLTNEQVAKMTKELVQRMDIDTNNS